jgi:hypothetical protein
MVERVEDITDCGPGSMQIGIRKLGWPCFRVRGRYLRFWRRAGNRAGMTHLGSEEGELLCKEQLGHRTNICATHTGLVCPVCLERVDEMVG